MQYDISIIGGGLVGSLAALSLANLGLHIALIDSKKPVAIGNIPELRVSALTPFSWNLLRELGVTAKLDSARLSKILAMEIFETLDQPLYFYASEMGREQLGLITENEVLLQTIQSQFNANVTLFAQNCIALKREAQGFQLNLSNGESLQTRFLILAQGSEASFAQQLGLTFKTFDYQEEALVFHVETEHPHQQTAYQRFLPEGPLAFLPLYQKHWSSIVWTLPRQKAQYLKSCTPTDLATYLIEAFPRLGNLQIISPVASFPLYAQEATHTAGRNFVVLGDAAHTVHPLAGQGVNLGFRDVAQLTQIIQQMLTQHFSLNDPLLSDRYMQATTRHNRLMSKGFSLIHYFYANPSLFKLRQLGIHCLNRFIPLKKQLMKIAMGEHTYNKD